METQSALAIAAERLEPGCVSPFDIRWRFDDNFWKAPTPAKSVSENRRLGLRLKTQLSGLIGRGRPHQECRVSELSPTGCVVCGANVVPTGSVLRLAISIPVNRMRLTVTVRAVRMAARGQAFEFMRLSDEHRLLVAETMDALTPGRSR